MDNYLEFLVQKNKEAKDAVLKILSFIITLVLCILALNFLGQFGFLGAILIVYLEIKVQDYFSVEYEYCVIAGDIDIDRIYGRKRRKKYISLEANSIEQISLINSPEISSFIKSGAKKYYACKNKNSNENLAISGYSKKGGKIVLIIENDEKIVNAFKSTMPRKVLYEK